MTKTKRPVKIPAIACIDLTKFESVAEQLELTSEQRRERIQEIKDRGWV